MPFRKASGGLILLALLLASACSSKGNPSGPGPLPEKNSTIFYTAMGASDVTGIGGSVLCSILFGDCPEATGYVYVAAQQLRARGFTVSLTNLGIPTATLGRSLQDLGNQYGHLVAGNLVENESPVVPAKATLITIFAGVNDVNVVTGALGGGAGAADRVGFIDSQVRTFGADYAALLDKLRTRAPNARIVALNVPNIGMIPSLERASLAQRQAAQRLSVGMTTEAINPLAAKGVIVIDMMCDPRSYQASTYSSDGLHPSDAGYAWMAAEVVAAATTAYKAPQATCGAMSVIPQ